MRALVFSRYGGPDVMDLVELPDPVAGPGELLVRTAAAGLNPVDALQREGTFKVLGSYSFPKVAGNELSGSVEAVGSGVSGFAVGDAVIARTGGTDLGALAELATIPAEYAAHAPTSVPLVDAAGLPLAGLTAQQALGAEHLDLRAGERLLVTGGAGGVGLLAIQLARAAGAEVTATASPAGEALVREAGATHVINYRERTVAEGGERFDKVLDLVGGDDLADLFGSVERGGRLVTLSGPPTPGSLTENTTGLRRAVVGVAERLQSRKVRAAARAAGVSYEFFLMHPDGQGLAQLAQMVDAGELQLHVDSRHPAKDFRDAFARLESHRAKGKVLVEWGFALGR